MKIILVGMGKVGTALAGKLSDEGHNITVIDISSARVSRAVNEFDVMGITGNGASIGVLSEAGMENADLLIAVTGSDELNLLCCMFAKKAEHCKTVARVRNPMYSHELDYIKKQLGISAIINPELATAKEISKLLRFPGAEKIDTFADGKVRLIKFCISDSSGLHNLPVKDIPARFDCDILICAVERDGEVIIPDGDFSLKNNDLVTFLATPDKASAFFSSMKLPTAPVRSSLIVGGGTIGYYLAKELLSNGVRVRVVDNDTARCETLAELLPKATILNGDGTDRNFLLSSGLPLTESFVALTNMDEENIMLSMFAKKHSHAKLVTKINRLDFDDIIDEIQIGSVIYPKYLTCDFILQHARALQNASGSNIKTLYRILDDRVEALEFTVHSDSAVTKVPLCKLKLKPNQLICCISRGDEIIVPRGSDHIQVGDSVIVVTLEKGLQDILDIIVD